MDELVNIREYINLNSHYELDFHPCLIVLVPVSGQTPTLDVGKQSPPVFKKSLLFAFVLSSPFK